MNIAFITAVIFACLCAAVLAGIRVRRRLSEHHLNAETRDVVKLSIGLIATMSALLLGLLISSAKDSYDTSRGEVIQLAANVTFLDRVLARYGPEAAPLRAGLHAAVEQGIQQLWSEPGGAAEPHVQAGDALYIAIQNLSPRDEMQRILKDRAANLGLETGQLRTLLHAQSVTSISTPLLVVVILWLVMIFFGFSLLGPPNATPALALMVSALSVAGAIFLILELDRPFTGVIKIPSEPLANALKQTPR